MSLPTCAINSIKDTMPPSLLTDKQAQEKHTPSLDNLIQINKVLSVDVSDKFFLKNNNIIQQISDVQWQNFTNNKSSICSEVDKISNSNKIKEVLSTFKG